MKKTAPSPVAKRRRVAAARPAVPFRCENVTETSVRFNLPMPKITEFRGLAKKDPDTDPWIGDFTDPEQFHRWLWGKRIELEKIERQRHADGVSQK